jgi:hypothetical protein
VHFWAQILTKKEDKRTTRQDERDVGIMEEEKEREGNNVPVNVLSIAIVVCFWLATPRSATKDENETNWDEREMTKLKPILCTPSSVIKTFSGLMSR